MLIEVSLFIFSNIQLNKFIQWEMDILQRIVDNNHPNEKHMQLLYINLQMNVRESIGSFWTPPSFDIFYC